MAPQFKPAVGARAAQRPEIEQASHSRPPIRFIDLWNAYPDSKPYVDAKTGEPPKGFENQCAIKVSAALHKLGIDLKSFRGAHVFVDDKKAATLAQQLATWLQTEHLEGIPATPKSITGEHWQEKINGRTGIIYFADYWLREGEKKPTGDHIDLWNGSRLTASGLQGTLVTLARFTLGLNSIDGLFSDLGKSKLILFWEVP